MRLPRWLSRTVTARRLARAMQASLVVVLGAGIVLSNVSVVVNAVFSLAVTGLPAVLERDYDVQLDPVIVLWVTTAVFLHSLGMVGIYTRVWWWDHLTHAFSGALVAAVGYAGTRAVDEYADGITVPPAFLWLFVFLSTVALGVCWETFEMGGRALAEQLALDPVLIVYGVDDIVLDLVFDIVGAVLVAALAQVGGGRALLENFATALGRR